MIQCFGFRRLFLLCLLLLLPLPALGSSTINLSFAGKESFILSGADLEDAGRIEANVFYDSSLLANPRLVTRNSFGGAIATLDGDTAGSVRITVISDKPMKGDGTFATLVFDPLGTSIGYIKSFSGRVHGTNGTTLIASFSLTNPTPQLDPSDPDDLPMIKEREAKGQSFMGGEVAYLPPEVAAEKESGEQDETIAEAEEAAASGESSAAQAADIGNSRVREKEAESSAPQAQSVLERFRLFNGERNPKNLAALFDTTPDVSFKQEPPIFLADGKGIVKVTIAKVVPGKTPSFIFRTARYVSCRKLSENEWLVESRPKKATTGAGITLIADGKQREIPLTVAPKVQVDLTTPGKVTEADFALFLKERGTADIPRYDLNGDGKRDYLDDYIFAANYLLELEKNRKKTKTPGQIKGS